MDTNKPILIAAPAWLNAALYDHTGEPDTVTEDDPADAGSVDIPLGFV